MINIGTACRLLRYCLQIVNISLRDTDSVEETKVSVASPGIALMKLEALVRTPCSIWYSSWVFYSYSVHLSVKRMQNRLLSHLHPQHVVLCLCGVASWGSCLVNM